MSGFTSLRKKLDKLNNPSLKEERKSWVSIRSLSGIRLYQKRYRLKKSLFHAMEKYWNGKCQVAPLKKYLKTQKRELGIQSPEDLAWIKDPEGVMLGKYDF